MTLGQEGAPHEKQEVRGTQGRVGGCPLNREWLLERDKPLLQHRGLESHIRVRARSPDLESQAEECSVNLLQDHKHFRKASWQEGGGCIEGVREPRTLGEARQLPASKARARKEEMGNFQRNPAPDLVGARERESKARVQLADLG